MSGETRLKATMLWAATATLAGLGVVEALEQFGAPPALATFFPFVPVVVLIGVALSLRSLAFVDVVRGGAFTGEAAGWAIAGLSAGLLVLLAAPAATALAGGRGLLLLLAFLAGLALALFLILPQLGGTGEPTLAAAIGRRFGPAARTLAALAVFATLLPLVAAQASLAGIVGARMLGIPAADARDGTIALAALACLLGGTRASLAMAAVAAPIVAVAYLLPVSIVSFEAGALPLPWIGLFEPASFNAPTRLPATIFVALAVCLVAGLATLPSILLPAASRARRGTPLRSRAVGLAVAAAIVLAAPSYGLIGAGLGIDATINPAGLVINFAERAGLSASPSVLLIGGLFAAALVATTAMLTAAAIAIGNDLYAGLIERSAPEGRRIFIARLAAVAMAVMAALLCRASGDDAGFLAASGLSIGAASLGPVLLIAWHLGRAGPNAAVATLAVGLWLTLADIGLALLLPDVAGRFLGMGTILPTMLGPTGWFGLPVGLSGLPATLAAVLTLWGVTELPRVDWPRLGRRGRALSEAAIRALARMILGGVERWQARRKPSAAGAVAGAAAAVPAPADALPAPAAPAAEAEAPPAPDPAALPKMPDSLPAAMAGMPPADPAPPPPSTASVDEVAPLPPPPADPAPLVKG